MCCQEGSNNDKVSNGNNDKGEPIEMENPPINQDHLIHLKKAVDCEVGDFSTFLRVFHLSIFSSSLLSLPAFLSPPICKIHEDLVEYLNIWIFEYLNIWIFEYLNIWIYEYLNIWTHLVPKPQHYQDEKVFKERKDYESGAHQDPLNQGADLVWWGDLVGGAVVQVDRHQKQGEEEAKSDDEDIIEQVLPPHTKQV